MSDSPGELRLEIEGALSEPDSADVIAGEAEPFGPVGASLIWRPKDRHVTLRDAGGRLLGVAGALVATITVDGQCSFDVVGLGSLIVTPALRGRGLMVKLVEPLLRLSSTLGPERAMLFCRPELVGLYQRFEFAEIAAPVWVDQPSRRVLMPEPAMWRPLRPDATWPAGRVDVQGLPF